MKILLTFSYDGSKFHGFQRQNNARNVQSDMENALKIVYGEEMLIKGAGRTDAKVHAINQCAHFETDKKVRNIKFKLNNNLTDIKIKKVKRVKNNFHARYNVKEKTYVYKLSLDKNDDDKYYGYYYGNIDFNKMENASKLFIGKHNFKNFVAGYRDNYVSTIFSVKVKQRGRRIYFTFKGHGFYRYMVRNLVGALIDYSKGKVNKDELIDMLENYEKEKVLSTAKAEGLYLYNIKY